MTTAELEIFDKSSNWINWRQIKSKLIKNWNSYDLVSDTVHVVRSLDGPFPKPISVENIQNSNSLHAK